jgi:hypothetical protein
MEQIESLQKYLSITSHFLPTRPEFHYLLKPTLRHPDINPRNIFVDKELQITSLIDWQHASAVPLFLQAGVPTTFANFGDEESLQMKVPKLPDNLSALSESEQLEAIEKFRRRNVHFFYVGGAFKFNNPHYTAIRLPSVWLKQRLCFNASAPWQGNPIPLKAALINAMLTWDKLTAESADATACPISFSESEIAECLRINAGQENIDEKLEILREQIGISTDGWTPLERYDGAVAENEATKERLLADETEEEKKIVLEHWPFDDHSENGLS